MPNIGPAEILVILVVALLVFGPNKLPEIGRQVGKAARELRRMQASLSDEVRDVLDPPAERARPPKLAAPSTPGSTREGDEAGQPGEAGEGDEGGDEDLSPVDDAGDDDPSSPAPGTAAG